jgi:hypothetical protein
MKDNSANFTAVDFTLARKLLNIFSSFGATSDILNDNENKARTFRGRDNTKGTTCAALLATKV